MRRTDIILIPIVLLSTSLFGQFSISKDTLLMGSYFSVTAIHNNEDSAKFSIINCIEEVVRIEKLISSWDPKSQTSIVNSNSGKKPVKVNYELYGLIERCNFLSSITNGSFDISFSSLDNIWDFKRNYTDTPDSLTIAKSVDLINYKNIELNALDTSVFLTKKGTKIGFGAVGKGYAADMCKNILIENGCSAGVVNAGGDMSVFGKKINGKKWNVGIVDPRNTKKFITSVPIENQSIVTSGNYERYVYIEGIKYAHIIDPRTGWPVQGVSSVTVISHSSELADALATAIFVLGKKDGMKLVNQLKGTECVIIDEKHRIFQSDNIELIPIKND